MNQNCFVIGVIGGKGGVGKSIFAANLALAFRLELKTQVLLMDLDAASCGDQNVIIGVRPNRTIAEVCQNSGVLNPTTVKNLVDAHPSGLQFIAAVKGPEETLNVSPDLVVKTIESLSNFFRFIVIDLGSTLNPLQMSIIGITHATMVLTTPEILVLNQTARILNNLSAATLPLDMFQIVVNKVAATGLPAQVVSQMLRRPVLGMIPQDDATVLGSLQRSTPFVLAQAGQPVSTAYHDLVRRLSGGLLQKLATLARPKPSELKPSGAVDSQGGSLATGSTVQGEGPKKDDPRNFLKRRIHAELIVAMDLKKGIADTKNDPAKEKALADKTLQMITQITDKLAPGTVRQERAKIIKEVMDEALFLGPLQDLLNDPTISEIMVNGHDQIFVERNGKLTHSTVTFTSNSQLRIVIERIVTPLGRRIDEKTPYVDARIRGGVADGSRVNAIIEPLAIDGPALTIRKFARDPITAMNYINWGSATKAMMDFLKICVENGLNVIISGGTGTGKTTLLNVLSGYIPASERIITVEDAAELQLKQDHVVRLETRPANMEGSGAITIRDLIRNSLRMRPDRIVVGECRDGSALDMLSAMNTGHDGSMTTVHANNPREAVARLETLCLMAGMDLPTRAIREQIAGAVDLIVQISRLSDGTRKLSSLTEVVGMQGDTVTLQEVFRFKEEGFDKNRKVLGTFQPTGLIPTFIEKFEQRGVIIPRNLFSATVAEGPKGNPVAGGGLPPPGSPLKPGTLKKAGGN